ncbi:MAG: HNH endonuclease [Ferruginibacter sp.]|nr:HNH endonuclease [Ferruginibacter sp.]
MVKDYPGEQWKIIQLDFEYSNNSRMEVSNFGRLRSFHKLSNGNLVNGSMVNGYRIIRMKFFKAREEKMVTEMEHLKQRISNKGKQLKALKENKESKALIEETSTQLADLKKSLTRKVKADVKKRTIYFQPLVHRLVATYFLKKPSTEQTIVGHLDYNKLNNRAYNLKWMTPEENYAHQKKAPGLAEAKRELRYKRVPGSTTKLTETKVMLLKKLLNQNKPIRQLVKQFKITDTQIIRIKKGINWGDIPAAP